MYNIKIEWLIDEHDCDTCGTTYARGAHVSINGVIPNELTLSPVAHCYDGSNYETEDVYEKILKYLGHNVEIISPGGY